MITKDEPIFFNLRPAPVANGVLLDFSATWENAQGTYVADFREDLDHIARALSTERNPHETCFCDEDGRCVKLVDGDLNIIAEINVTGEAGKAETMTVSLIASQVRLTRRFEEFAPDKVNRVIVEIVDSL